MPDLHTLSLSFSLPNRVHRKGIDDLPRFPASTPRLESVFLTLSSDRALIPPGGVDHLISQLPARKIKRLSILNLFLTTIELSILISRLPGLEELYTSIISRTALLDCTDLQGSALKILHVNAPESARPTPDDLRFLAGCISTLEQVGTGNRVYEVSRRYEGEERLVEISRWSKTYTPGYFQIWRG